MKTPSVFWFASSLRKKVCGQQKSERHHRTPKISHLVHMIWDKKIKLNKPCGQHRKCILSCQQLRLNTCVSENAAALEELLLEYESKQMAMNKGSSIKYVAHTNDHLPVAFLIFFFFLLFLGQRNEIEAFSVANGDTAPPGGHLWWKHIPNPNYISWNSDRILQYDLQKDFLCFSVEESRIV